MTVSPTARFHGQAIQKARGIPIGLIATSVGGTPAEAWSSPAAIQKCTNPPPMPPGPVLPPQANTVLWQSMVVPLLRTTIKGVVWWQGEANADWQMQPKRYACVFPAMIESWRRSWSEHALGTTASQFPFGFVQLSTWADQQNRTCGTDARACSAATVRFGQTANVGSVPNLRMPNTYMAVGVDLGDPTSPWGDSESASDIMCTLTASCRHKPLSCLTVLFDLPSVSNLTNYYSCSAWVLVASSFAVHPRWKKKQVSHCLQLQSLWIVPTAAVSEHVFSCAGRTARARHPRRGIR